MSGFWVIVVLGADFWIFHCWVYALFLGFCFFSDFSECVLSVLFTCVNIPDVFTRNDCWCSSLGKAEARGRWPLDALRTTLRIESGVTERVGKVWGWPI